MNQYLLVIDMQNDFIDGALGTKEAEAIVPAVEQAIEAFEGTVAYTMDTHQEGYLDTQEGRKLPVAHCIEGTAGWEVQERIKCALEGKNAKAFHKPTFGSRELSEFLAAENEREPIDQIVLVGLCTDICVISNALLVKAYLPETAVRVLARCCAGVTAESHENALMAMEMCQVEIDRG